MKKKYIFIIVIAALMFIAFLRLDGESILYSIRQIPIWLVLLMLALQVVTQLLVSFQWHRIAKLSGISITYRDILYVNSQGAVIDSITPGVKFGGEVTRAVQISRVGNCSGEQGAALVALQKLFSLSAMFFILLFVVGYLAGEVPGLSARYMQLLVYSVLSLFLLLFFAIFFMPHRIEAYMHTKKAPRFTWTRKLRGFFLMLLNHVKSVRNNKRACMMLALLSLFIWLLYPVKMYILTVQFYPEAGMIHVAAITFAAYMVAMLPVFPGGLGGFEGTMSGLLIAMGMVVSDAVVTTVFFRFATFWFVMLFSIAYVAVCNLRKTL